MRTYRGIAFAVLCGAVGALIATGLTYGHAAQLEVDGGVLQVITVEDRPTLAPTAVGDRPPPHVARTPAPTSREQVAPTSGSAASTPPSMRHTPAQATSTNTPGPQPSCEAADPASTQDC